MSQATESLSFQCPSCRHEFHLEVAADVEAVICPDCGVSVAVPRFETLRVPPERPATPEHETRTTPEGTDEPPAAGHATAADAPGTTAGRVQTARGSEGTTRPKPIYDPVGGTSTWKRLRRWWFQTFIESRVGLVFLLGAITVGAVTTWAIWNQSETQRHQALVASAWDKGDVAFRQAQFDAAAKAYQQVIARSDDWGKPGQVHAELARLMTGLAEQASEVSKSLEDETASLTQGAHEGLKQAVSELLADQAMPSSGTAPNEAPDEDLPVGLDFTVSARAGKLIDGWLVGQAERMATGLTGDTTVDPVAVQRLEELAGWLSDWQRDTTKLETVCQEARARILRSGHAAQFTAAGKSALADYSAESVLKALEAHDAWQTSGGGADAEAAHSEFLQSLAAQLKESQTLEDEPDGGRPLAVGPPVVPLSAGAAKSIDKSREVVFVNDEDQLYVLDAETGVAGWAVRRGFNNGWLPSNGRVNGKSVCLVSWRRGERVYLSCLESHSGLPVWTRRMPTTDGQMWQAALVHESSVLVPSEAGLVLQLDLGSGKTRSRVQLPEALAAHCVLNAEDGRIACLGRALGTYTLGLSPDLAIEEVHVRDAAIGVGEAHVAWIDSLLLVAVNRADSRCQLSVYRVGDGRFLHTGEDIEIEGHLWQQPTVLGDSVFLATDSGQLAKLVVSPDSQERPVKLVWSTDGDAARLGMRPYVVSHAEAPLLMGFGGTVTSSFPAMNESEGGVRTAWKWEVASEAQVVCQPLQICLGGVVVAVRQPGETGVVVNCLDLTSGRRRWRWSGDRETPAPDAAPDTSVDRRPWSMVIGHFHPIKSLDPWNAVLPLERELVPLLFDRLLQPDVRGLRHVKGPLVRGYEVLPGTRRSPSGAACRAYRFRLDNSRLFHDGSPLDAEDVVESIHRLGESRVRWGQREQSRMLRSPRMLEADRVEILVRPYLAVGSLLNVYVAPRRHYAEIPAAGSALSAVPVGSGRFEVVDRSRPQEIVLRRSPHHPSSRSGQSGIQELVLRRFAASGLDELASQWRDGRLDMIAGLDTAELSALKAKGVDGQVRTVASRRVAVLVFNHRAAPFDDLQIRHKVARLLDMRFRRDVIARAGRLDGGAVGVDSVIPPGGLEVSRQPPPPLPEALVEHYLTLLKEAAGGRVLSLKVDVSNHLAERGAAAIAARLSASSSASVKLQRLSADQFQDEVRQRHSFDLAVCVLDYSDPLLQLGGLLDTRASCANVPSMNFLGFRGQQLMQTIVDFREAQRWSEVVTARQRLDDLLRDHAVVVPLWTDPQFAILSKSIRSPSPPVNRCPGPWLFHRLAEWRRGK